MEKHKTDTKAHDELLTTLKHLSEEIDLDREELCHSNQRSDKPKSMDDSQENKTA